MGIAEESDENGSEGSTGFGEEDNVAYEGVSVVYFVLCMLC